MESPHPNLRAWRDDDIEPLVEIHHHPEVCSWLGGKRPREGVEELMASMREKLERQGWGVWVVRDDADRLVGAAGIDPIGAEMPVAGIEALWRLHPVVWGKGLVTRTMGAVLDDAFRAQGIEEVWTYTAETNRRSQAVMKRLGFERAADRDFNHPRLDAAHPLSRHVVFHMSAETGVAA